MLPVNSMYCAGHCWWKMQRTQMAQGVGAVEWQWAPTLLSRAQLRDSREVAPGRASPALRQTSCRLGENPEVIGTMVGGPCFRRESEADMVTHMVMVPQRVQMACPSALVILFWPQELKIHLPWLQPKTRVRLGAGWAWSRLSTLSGTQALPPHICLGSVVMEHSDCVPSRRVCCACPWTLPPYKSQTSILRSSYQKIPTCSLQPRKMLSLHPTGQAWSGVHTWATSVAAKVRLMHRSSWAVGGGVAVFGESFGLTWAE